MVKINGENREHLIGLNILHLREKINKTCANRPVSCVNGEDSSERMPFGSPKESAYRCAERERTLTESFSASFSSKNIWKSSLSDFASAILLSEQKDTGGNRNERRWAAVCGRSCRGVYGDGRVPVLGGHPAGGDGRAGCSLTHSRECRETSERRLENTNVKWM